VRERDTYIIISTTCKFFSKKQEFTTRLGSTGHEKIGRILVYYITLTYNYAMFVIKICQQTKNFE
jgi:hypothetical protein